MVRVHSVASSVRVSILHIIIWAGFHILYSLICYKLVLSHPRLYNIVLSNLILSYPIYPVLYFPNIILSYIIPSYLILSINLSYLTYIFYIILYLIILSYIFLVMSYIVSHLILSYLFMIILQTKPHPFCFISSLPYLELFHLILSHLTTSSGKLSYLMSSNLASSDSLINYISCLITEMKQSHIVKIFIHT